jgi:hypothetical protein
VSDRKFKCVNVTRPDTHPGLTCVYLLEPCQGANASLFDGIAELDGAETGEQVVLTVSEYTAKELKALEDFDGW